MIYITGDTHGRFERVEQFCNWCGTSHEDILELLHIGENHEIGCELSEGGIPDSEWKTYSSFANTEGGTIFLGIKEHRDSFAINGLDERKLIKFQKDFWSILNNRAKISKNIY